MYEKDEFTSRLYKLVEIENDPRKKRAEDTDHRQFDLNMKSHQVAGSNRRSSQAEDYLPPKNESYHSIHTTELTLRVIIEFAESPNSGESEYLEYGLSAVAYWTIEESYFSKIPYRSRIYH